MDQTGTVSGPRPTAEATPSTATCSPARNSSRSADGRGPLTVPVWYTYQPGGTVNLSTGRNTRKALAIAAAGRFSLCAQDERPPYKYVTVEGPAALEEATDAERLELARKYLGTEGGDAYLAANPGGSQVMIRMTPEHWLSRAYSDG